MGMDDFHRRSRDANFEVVRQRMRIRLAADPILANVAANDPQTFCAMYDREKQVMAAEAQRAFVADALLAEPEAEPEADWRAEVLKENAQETGREEDLVRYAAHLAGEEVEDE